VLGELKMSAKRTSEFRHHIVEMYYSAVIAFTHLYTYDLDF